MNGSSRGFVGKIVSLFKGSSQEIQPAALVKIAQVCALVTMLAGFMVFMAWLFRIELIKSALPGLISMKINTSLCFILTGMALALRSRPRVRRASAAFVAILAALTLSQYVTGLDLRIDQFLMRDSAAVATPFPGRMAPSTAIGFIFIGIALVFIDVRRLGARHGVELLIILTGANGVLGLLGYAYGVEQLYRWFGLNGIALNTALTFVILSLGALCARQDGLAIGFASQGIGGRLARRLLLPVLLLPALFGWLTTVAEHAGLLGPGAGVVLFCLLMMLGPGVIVLHMAFSLDAVDAKRAKAVRESEEHLRRTNTELEARVTSQTAEIRRSNEALEQRISERTADLQRANASLLDARRAALNLMEDAVAARKQAERTSAELKAEIFERKRVEEELRLNAERLAAANRELESFSYSVSHDLRTPLRVIKGFSDILLEDYSHKLDAEGRDFLKRIINGVDKMSELIDDMLSLAKISRHEMSLQKIDLSALAGSIFSQLRQVEPERKVEAILHREMTAYGDERLMHIALSNLIENAWKYSGKAPEARIEFGAMERSGEKVYFVRDNGVGFDMTHAHKLFAPFQRLHSDGQFPGTGIGLAIVNKIIQRHGGRVWGEGETGKGATFCFTLAFETRGLKKEAG